MLPVNAMNMRHVGRVSTMPASGWRLPVRSPSLAGAPGCSVLFLELTNRLFNHPQLGSWLCSGPVLERRFPPATSLGFYPTRCQPGLYGGRGSSSTRYTGGC